MRPLRAYLTTTASLFAIAMAISMVALDFFSAAFGWASVALFQWWAYLYFLLLGVAGVGVLLLALRRADGWRYLVAIGIAAALSLMLRLSPTLAPGRLLARLITG